MVRVQKTICNVMLLVIGVVYVLCGCGNDVKSGAKLLEEGNVEEAVSAFEQVISDKKSSQLQLAEAYRGLGMCFYELQQYDQAQDNLQKAVETGGEETPVLYHLIGVSAMHQGDFSAALSAFEKGIGLSETEETNGRKSGSGQDETGSAEYSEMIREMYYNRVACHEKLYDWEQAYAAAKEYLEKYPDDETMQHEAEFLETR